MRQQIDGNGNIQAGGDVLLTNSPQYPKDNPNIVKCPQCWLDTGRHSHQCPQCGYDVAGHFMALARAARRQQLYKVGGVSGLMAVVALMGSQYLGLMHSSFSVEINGFILGAFGVAGLCLKAASDN